jgi:hypothetical protein
LEFPNCLAIIIINYTPAIMHPLFLSEAVESAKRPHTLHESKALNMGIAELEPRQ